MKVLLLCNLGMSTSLLVNAMRKNAGPDDQIDAFPESELSQNMDGVDVILLGPQIRFKEGEITAAVASTNIKVGVVESRVYGMMDGKAAMDQARKLAGGA